MASVLIKYEEEQRWSQPAGFRNLRSIHLGVEELELKLTFTIDFSVFTGLHFLWGIKERWLNWGEAGRKGEDWEYCERRRQSWEENGWVQQKLRGLEWASWKPAKGPPLALQGPAVWMLCSGFSSLPSSLGLSRVWYPSLMSEGLGVILCGLELATV